MHGPAAALPSALLEALACPACHVTPEVVTAGLRCPACGQDYPIRGRVADLRLPEATSKAEHGDWIEHWSNGKQQLFSQRFFSLYRKAVFARTVAYFIQHYFPARGLFVEAGSGTSETSCRIDKRRGERVLVATDIVAEVLQGCDPAMDARVAADVFHLPFLDGSIDGIWNVGVMEHFPHDQIDSMLQEFRRVLRPGAPLLLLWPATDSLPQKGLRMVEAVINARRQGERFRFHPDEISKLRSSEEGRSVMRRNGFEPVTVDAGLRSLMAFKTVVGRKPLGSPAAQLQLATTKVDR